MQLATNREPADLRSLTVPLREAVSDLERHDHLIALSPTARALAMAPDQPQIIADVQRLLGRMGQSADAKTLRDEFWQPSPEHDALKQADQGQHPAISSVLGHRLRELLRSSF